MGGKKTVLGISVYKFEFNQADNGEIEPEFRLLVAEYASEARDLAGRQKQLISVDDQFGLFFTHTAGSSWKKKGKDTENIFVGRLKDTPYKVMSHYVIESDESQYLTVAFFKLTDDIEIFEDIFRVMAKKLGVIFNQLMVGNFKDKSFVFKMEEKIWNEVKFTVFQIQRLENLTKLQKMALIFTSDARIRTLEILREGPIPRQKLAEELEAKYPNINIDVVLEPFMDLNIVRRDWARGDRNSKTGRIENQGEYIFLIKDVGFVRKPPERVMKQVKSIPDISRKYQRFLRKYYSHYDPFPTLNKESKNLAQFLIDPDIFDFLTLLGTKVYPKNKIPKVTSKFSNFDELISLLVYHNLIHIFKDDKEREWVVLVAEIHPIVIFPEYLISRIARNSPPKRKRKKEKYLPPDEMYLSSEVGLIALNLLEHTHGEKIEFKEVTI